MANKRLVYTIAFGDYFRRVATMLVQSIRVHDFDGDIVILSNDDREIVGATVINITSHDNCAYIKNQDDNRKLFRNTTEDHRYDYISARMFIDKFVNIQDYDKLMFLDADVLAVSNIGAIFDASSPTAITCVARKRVSLKRALYEFGNFLSPEHKTFSRRHSKSNAGMLCFSRDICEKFLPRWRELWLQYMYSDFQCYRKDSLLEEHLLNYLFATKEFEFFRTELWGFHRGKDEKPRILYHFAGKKKKRIPTMIAMYEQNIVPLLKNKGLERV